MKFIESVTIAIAALLANKLRSLLTMLGVIIGVGAVITLMSVGRGAQASIVATFEQMGSNLLYITSQTPGVEGMAALQMATPSLTLDDAEAIETRVSSVLRVASITENYAEVIAGNESTVAVVEATTPEFEQVSNYPAAQGQFITDRHVASRDMVVVLGQKVVDDLFDMDDPIGQKVKINERQFTVIGVLEAKGGQIMGVSMDSIIVVPITTYQARLFPRKTVRGEDAVQTIAVQIESQEMLEMAKADITDLLRRRHRIGDGDKDDFTIMSQEQMLDMFQQVMGVFTLVLGAIASISLLVGSIGIMNIMLVSVTERTREIGIRKAVGAKRRDILMQFLLEAAVLSMLGGGIGILLGSSLAWVISLIDIGGGQVIETAVSADIIILAVSVSIFVGLVSGIYPAIRAARLNPIDALHYE